MIKRGLSLGSSIYSLVVNTKEDALITIIENESLFTMINCQSLYIFLVQNIIIFSHSYKSFR